MALTKGVGHIPGLAIYGALIGFAAVLTSVGVQGFRRRVLA